MFDKIITCFKDCLQCEKKYKYKKDDICENSETKELLTEIVIDKLNKDNFQGNNESKISSDEDSTNYVFI